MKFGILRVKWIFYIRKLARFFVMLITRYVVAPLSGVLARYVPTSIKLLSDSWQLISVTL
jgi:hypothetical protein